MVEAAKEMKWAITGAGGQLGRELIELLNELGYQTQSWSRQDLDITADSSVGIIVDAKPDVIVNCAAWTDVDRAELEPEKAFAANQHGAAALARAARELQIPIIHISSDYVFSGEGLRPWKVSDRTEPTTVYGRSKLAGEQEVLSIYPEQSYILRTAWLYGRYGVNFPSKIIERLLSSDDVIQIVDDQFGQPTSAKDLSYQIVKLVENEPPFGIYHATNSGEASWFEFSQHILGLMNESSKRIVPISTIEYPQPTSRPKYSVLDHSNWVSTSLSPMRNWKNAIDETFAEIIECVRVGIRRG